ncbi:zinc-binding protein A33-like [Rhinoraja longicauda]
MASMAQSECWTEDVVCPICLDLFTHPVSLECGHNFCRSCITQSWDREGRNSCPECREEFADRSLRVNRALVSITEKARTLSPKTESKQSKLHCEEHQEELKLFCETDKQLICLICRDAREHREHLFMPIKEAVEIFKEKIKTSLETLTKNKSAMEEMEQQQKEKISGVQEEYQNLVTYITSVFAELRQILNEKELLFLKDLLEEENSVLNPMEKNLRAIQEEINSMPEKCLKLQDQLNLTDSLMFLKEETLRKRRVSDEALTLSVAEGALAVERFDHPFLLNTVFTEVPDGITRVSVTLDVETAHPMLEVSEDRKRVRSTGIQRSLPDNGRRFAAHAWVLGSEGFTSGRHYWEVEVAGSRRWSLGVAAESVERKGPAVLTQENGVWRIRRRDDEFGAFTSPPSLLRARPIPGRVGVYLSYESGTVSFYDEDTKSHLHTFTGNKFTEKLYPFFGTWDINQWLRICSGSAPCQYLINSINRSPAPGI